VIDFLVLMAIDVYTNDETIVNRRGLFFGHRLPRYVLLHCQRTVLVDGFTSQATHVFYLLLRHVDPCGLLKLLQLLLLVVGKNRRVFNGGGSHRALVFLTKVDLGALV